MIFILQLRIITLYMVERGNVFSGHNLNYSIQETFLKILMALAQKFCVIYSFFVILTAHTHEVLHECRKREHSLRIISFIHILTYFSLRLDFPLSLYTNIDCTRLYKLMHEQLN